MAKKNKKNDNYGYYGYYGGTTDSAELAVNEIGAELSFAASESYKLLRTNLSFCLPNDDGKKCRIMGITSATQGEGKSTTSVNLSYSLAEAGYRTLLIECDMRLPTIATRLGLKKAPGLSNVVAGQNNGSIIQLSGIHKNLFVVSSGDIPPNPSELLTSDRMSVVMGEFVKYYDYIILDLPPVNIVSDALAVARLTDGIILVVREDYSDKRSVKDAVSKFRFSQTNILGFVLTCAGIDGKGGYRKGGIRYRKYKYGPKYARYRYSGREHSYGGYSYGYDRSAKTYKDSADELRAQISAEASKK